MTPPPLQFKSRLFFSTQFASCHYNNIHANIKMQPYEAHYAKNYFQQTEVYKLNIKIKKKKKTCNNKCLAARIYCNVH